MSSIKISQLPQLPSIAANTSNTLFLGVDIPSGVTGKFTATTLAQQLYSNNSLTVGNNQILFSNTVSQFSGYDPTFLQINMQNFNSNGSGDFIVTGDKGTNSNNYIDMGLNGSNFQTNYTVGSAFLPNDGYLYVNGPGQNYVGNLILGTTTSGTRINFVVGGANTTNIVAYMDATGIHSPSIDAEIAANTTYVLATANAEIGVVNSNVANVYVYSQSAYGLANTLNGTVTNLTGNVSVLQTAVAANANSLSSLTVYTQSAYASLNTLSLASNTANLTGFIQAAYNTANGALANTSGTIFGGDLQITGNITPTTTNTSYLGTPSNRFRRLYLTANAFHILDYTTQLDTSLTVSGGTLQVNGASAFALSNGLQISANGQILANNINITGNLSVNNVFSVSVPTQTLSMNGSISMSGSLYMNNNTFLANTAAVKIIGSTNFASETPSNDGYMLQITGKDNVPARVVIDSASVTGNAYSLLAGRASRGSANTPSASQSGDVLMRISGNGYGTTNYAQYGVARIDFVAAENFSDTNKGTIINIGLTPVGTNTVVTMASITSNNFTVNANLIPTSTNTVNLGSATNRWGDLWLAGNSINMLDTVTGNNILITIANGQLLFGNTQAFIQGNTTIYANGSIVAPNVIVTGSFTANSGTTYFSNTYHTANSTLTFLSLPSNNGILAIGSANVLYETANITVNDSTGTVTAKAITLSGNNVPYQYSGTWSPSVFFAGGSGTYTTQGGSFIKIGNMVTATFNIVAISVGTGAAALSLSGLPPVANVANTVSGSVLVSGVGGSVSSSVISPQGSIQPGATSVPIYTSYTVSGFGGSVTYRQVTGADLGGSFQISGTITYISA